MATLSARPRRRRGCGRCSRWPPALACRSGRTRSAEAARCCERPQLAPAPAPGCPARGGSAGRQPKQDLVVPLPALNPLHQSCHPRSWGVPATFRGHEGPVPSVTAAPHGPGVCVAPHVTPFCTELPGFAFPMGIAAVFTLLPQLWAGATEAGGAGHSSRVGCARPSVCSACSPWPCRQHIPVLQTCPGSFSLSVSRAGLSCCQELSSQDVCPALPVSLPLSLPRSQTWQQ